MSQLKQLIASRGRAKASITRMKNSCEDESFLLMPLEKIQAKRERIKEVFAEYDRLCGQILALDPDDAEESGVIEEDFIDIVSTLDIIANKRKSQPCSSSNDNFTHRLKLPNVSIPQFSGKYTEYYQFMDLFNAMIDRDSSLSPVQKMYYLKGALSGEAHALISTLPLKDDSYVEALRLLKERFDVKTKIVHEHINHILDLQVITRSTPANLYNIVSEVKQHLASLKNLGEPIEYWDSLVVCILVRKLDMLTSRAFKMERDNKSLPSLAELLNFLERRALALEPCESNAKPQPQRLTTLAATASSASASCLYCKSTDHKVYKCPMFQVASLNERLQFASDNKLCNICLSEHKRKCKYNFKCAVCKKGHNTLLHGVNDTQQAAPSVTLISSATQGQVLLPTARVKLISQSGDMTVYCRALLDSGSQASLVTQKVVDLLKLSPETTDTKVIGISNVAKPINKTVHLEVHSAVYPFKIDVDCHVVNTITGKLPQNFVDTSSFVVPPNCILADEDYHRPGDVHVLLGAEIFFQVLLPPIEGGSNEQRTLGQSGARPRQPSLVHTSFGHVVAGGASALSSTAHNKQVVLFCKDCIGSSELSDSMNAFWSAEKVPEVFPEHLPEQEFCENLFKSTTKLENNRFQVVMPTKVPLEQINSELGDSFHLALKRFLCLERKLQHNKLLFTEYKKFIDQYVDLGHGQYHDLGAYDLNKDPVFFLPHHAVIREHSRTTKLRTVFDGSMRTNKKVSLNDLLLNGPVVQKDLFEILISFRSHAFFFLCDIQKMFRCIEVDPSQRSLQNILWRESPDQDIKCIQLKTVTYGLKCSSYLATRCLIELAIQFESQYPLASATLKNNTYVDDVLVTSSSESELSRIKAEVVELLSMANFHLHKWASNCLPLLESIPVENRYFEDLELHNDMSIKTLGVAFDVKGDVFKTVCPEPYNNANVSKREILSYISKFFDPLGLIGPVFVRAKVIMQKLWFSEIGWDSTLPDNIHKMWVEFARDLSVMNSIKVPRCVTSQAALSVQLVGFSDASSVAYGCCIYLRSVDAAGVVKVELLCSKSRVNPLRKELTVPRLELNAALLLAKLVVKAYDVLAKTMNITDVCLFSDSQIVLAWLRMDVAKLGAYVSNRVRAIKELTHIICDATWLYVNTADNPADCLSRGLLPQELVNHQLWWHGPMFLFKNNFNDVESFVPPVYLPELRHRTESLAACVVAVNSNSNVWDAIEKFSNISKMIRVLAYVLRFCNNVRANNVKKNSFLSTSELSDALSLILKNEQHKHFPSQDKCLSGNLKPLSPFIDGKGIIRVGGRLHNASIPYDMKHPVILPKQSVVTERIIRDEHIKLLHAGQKLVLNSLKQRYWLVDGLRTVKKVIHKCVICFRLKALATSQLMGSLPAERVTECRPFQKVGVDFAGPVSVKNSRIRKSVTGKGYIVLFVCFATKAIHLELASDMSTDTFLACFKRFIARRNLPSDVYCDNGSAFKGARNQLDELYRLHNSKVHQDRISTYCSGRGVTFHFIPSYSPNFGGLWESGVKSAKYHLKRVVGKALLTYEQLNTVLVEIEGVLNSRPITAVSADPTDMSFLSPGHFLTGAPLNSYPERDLSTTRVNLLKFWTTVVHIKQNFWKSWSKAYLNLLQNRPKWRDNMPNVCVGSLVILRFDNMSPLNWPMARIVSLYPGKDGMVRAVEVRTANGHSHRRAISRICVLPIN